MWHSSYCRLSPHTAHIVFLLLMFPFLFPGLSTTDVPFLHCTLSSCFKIFSSYCGCDIPDTADFLLTLHTLSFYYQSSPSDAVILSSHCRTFWSYTADETLRVLHTFSSHTTNVNFQILQSFSSHQTHCDSMGDVAPLILHNLRLILQMQPLK